MIWVKKNSKISHACVPLRSELTGVMKELLAQAYGGHCWKQADMYKEGTVRTGLQRELLEQVYLRNC